MNALTIFFRGLNIPISITYFLTAREPYNDQSSRKAQKAIILGVV